VRDRLFGDGAVLAAAQRLHTETGLTVVLAVQSDLHAQYLHLVHSGEPFRAGVTPGQLRPLASSGMGWLLLAAQPDREVRRMVRRINYAGVEARVDIAALLARLHEVRVRGYAFSRDGVSPGFGLIGAMMPPPESGRRLAIGVAGRTADLEARESDLAARLAAVIHRPGPAIPG
jgi:DNA-binding IclR family transcriptional regulator